MDIRCRGHTLIYSDMMIDLNVAWMTAEKTITLENFGATSNTSPLRNTDQDPKGPKGQKGKKRGPVVENDAMANISGLTRDQGFFTLALKMWEERIKAEYSVLETVVRERITRKVAEKWWFISNQLSACVSDQATEIQNHLAGVYESQRKWHLDEKTRVGRYCLQDALLPLRLRKKHQFLISLVAMSQVTRVPCNLLMEKGQTIKIVNLFVIWARNNNYVVTVEPLPKVDFKGGQVLSPKKRFWMYRVFTLDFSSLYPSLIESNLLCYLSLILPRHAESGKFANRPDLEITSINIGEPR
jgi:hypothetical protein